MGEWRRAWSLRLSIPMRLRRFSLSPAAKMPPQPYRASHERPSILLPHLSAHERICCSVCFGAAQHYHRGESGDINGWPPRQQGRSGEYSVGEGTQPSPSQRRLLLK